MRGSSSLRGTAPPRIPPRATSGLEGVSQTRYTTGVMNPTEELSVVSYEALAGLKRSLITGKVRKCSRAYHNNTP